MVEAPASSVFMMWAGISVRCRRRKASSRLRPASKRKRLPAGRTVIGLMSPDVAIWSRSRRIASGSRSRRALRSWSRSIREIGISLKRSEEVGGGEVSDDDVAAGVDGDAEVMGVAGLEVSDPFRRQGDGVGVTESHEFSDCDWEASL